MLKIVRFLMKYFTSDTVIIILIELTDVNHIVYGNKKNTIIIYTIHF